MSSVLENALDAVVAMNTDGLIIEWNRQAEIIFGWTRDEVVGKRMSETIIPHKYRSAHEVGLKRFLKTGTGPVINNRLELSALRKDGSEFPIELTVTHLSEEKCFYAFLRDITERINFRKNLLENKMELERTLKNRDEFVSITSHELKNPLSVLGMQSQMLRRNLWKNNCSSDAREKFEQFLKHVDDQVMKLTRLVEEMQDVSRIRTGKLTMAWEEFDLNVLIKDILDKMHEQFIEANCGVPSFWTTSDQIVGTWDKLRVEQVVVNLFTNAIRYAGGNPIEVTVKVEREHVLISVKDHGMGIPKENQEKIFNPFERAEDPREVKSLGLGLYITKRIVEAHHGEIWVESDKGEGANFIVELPIVHGKSGQVEEVELRQS